MDVEMEIKDYHHLNHPSNTRFKTAMGAYEESVLWSTHETQISTMSWSLHYTPKHLNAHPIIEAASVVSLICAYTAGLHTGLTVKLNATVTCTAHRYTSRYHLLCPKRWMHQVHDT